MITTMITAISSTPTGWGGMPGVFISALTGRGWIAPEWGGVFNHLWQSTVFAAVAALLALALRKNHARARYWLWLAASFKFLVPFSLLVTLGASIGASIEGVAGRLWPSAPAIVAQPEITIMIDEISQPFTQVNIPAAAPEHHSMVPEFLLAVWLAGFAIVLISWFRRWLRVRTAVRSATPIPIELPLNTMSSRALLEPGIFGIFRPVLLLPEGIADRLTPPQLKSILAHELCHVKRRDNLAAAMHMVVEATFWFHPLVWWIGARLVEERERACDEEVLRSGNEPGVYAESILQVCKFYLESPLKCVAGVTGSDLKNRIESIMSGRLGRRLNPVRKLILTLAGVISIATPLIIGALDTAKVRAQSQDATRGFEVASIKRNNSGDRGSGIPPSVNGRFRAINVPARELIGYAYHTMNLSRISGGPGWLDSERYDIQAKAETKVPEDKIRPMVLKLLQDRFALKFHHEQKQMQVYVMTVAKGGPKFMVSNACMEDPEQKRPCGGFRVQHRSYIGGQQVSAADLAEVLEALLDQPVIDRTGIKGVFNMTLEWTPDERTPSGSDIGVAPVNAERPSLFAAMQEQLGLKLESTKAPVDIVVIDRAEKPSDNFEPPVAAAQAPAAQVSAQPARTFDGPAPAFEVASIKPCTYESEKTNAGGGATAPGRLSTGCGPLAEEGAHTGLIQRAYVRYEGARYHPLGPHGLIPIEGAPAWVHSEFFAIEAKAATPETPEMMQGPMMQKLLEERFKLKVHRETREGPVYNLTLAKSKLRPVKDDSCTKMPVPGMPRVEPRRGDHFCKFQVALGATPSIDSEGATVAEFISLLNLALDRQVIDKTGLAGRFDIHIDFAPFQSDAGDQTSDRPSIFTAVQEQLGLRLERGRGPNEFLVIDHVEKPTEN